MRDNRISMTRKEQKLIMLQILTKFAEFCALNNLNYFIDAGTLLGAVRHKGYIPWDDDIDVNMPIEDYDRFIQLTKSNKGFLAKHLVVEYPENTIYPFLKISDNRTILVEFPNKYPMEVGVYIDVFPKVGIMNDKVRTKILCKVCAFLGYIQWFNKFSINAWKNSNNNIKKCIAAFGRSVIKDPNYPVRLQNKLIHYNIKKHPLSECMFVTTLTNGEYDKKCNKKCFDGYVMIGFESKKFRAPVGYMEYLPCLYSETYMELPPIEKRRVHETLVFWKSADSKNEALEEIENSNISICSDNINN